MYTVDPNAPLFDPTKYEDITEEFRKVVGSMNRNGVAVSSDMKLSDTLSAFEIGLEKVDTGNPKNFKTIEEEIEQANSEFPIEASQENLCEFIDALCCSEMAWHSGSSMVQTLLSCLLLEQQFYTLERDPKKLFHNLILTDESELLFIRDVYVFSVLTSVGIAIDIAIHSGIIYAEEDLYTTRPCIQLVDQIGGVQMILEKLDSCSKIARSKGYQELAKRINARVTWLNILKQKIPKKTTHLDKMEQLVNDIFPEGATETSNKSQVWFSKGCEARLDMECLKLDLVTISRSQSRETWLKIINGIRHCTGVFGIERSVELMGFFLQFSLREEPAIVRAMIKLQVLLNDQILNHSFRQWAIKDFSETSPPYDAKLLKSKRAVTVLNQAALCYSNLLTCFCQNRCRLRDGLCMLFEAFETLQFNSLAGEKNEINSMLSFWIYFRKLQVMMWIILLGFETNIISYRELGYTNWFGFKISQTLLAHLGRMRQAFEVHGGGAREAPGYGFLVALELESQVLSQLLTAEYMLYIALHKGIAPPQPIAENGPSEEMLYGLRFQMFQGSTDLHPLESYKKEFEAFDIETALKGSANASRSASRLLNSLGSLADQNPEIPKLKRSAIGLSVAVASIIRGDSYAGELETKGYHPYFPVPKLKR